MSQIKLQKLLIISKKEKISLIHAVSIYLGLCSQNLGLIKMNLEDETKNDNSSYRKNFFKMLSIKNDNIKNLTKNNVKDKSPKINNKKYFVKIKNVILIGAAMHIKKDKNWKDYIEQTVIDKFINCYSTKDEILKSLYKKSSENSGRSPIGINSLEIRNERGNNLVVNYNFSENNFDQLSYNLETVVEKIFESYTGKTFPSFENIDNENEKLALKELWFAKNTNVSNIDTWNKYYDLHSEQDVLEYLVSRGSGTEHGKERINDFFEKNTNEQERIKFLINEYNWYSAYTGIFFMECKNDSKGIKVKAYITNPETEEITKYETDYILIKTNSKGNEKIIEQKMLNNNPQIEIEIKNDKDKVNDPMIDNIT